MSKALRCDRCKKCFVPEEEIGKEMIMFRNPTVYDAEGQKYNCVTRFREDLGPETFMDLCPNCAKLFTLFMNGDEDENYKT